MATHYSILARRIPWPQGRKESDMTEWLSLTYSLYSTGNYTQYLPIMYNGKESEKVYIYIYIYMDLKKNIYAWIQCMNSHIYKYMNSYICAAAAAKSLQLCPTLCDPIDGSPPGAPIPGILQARTLEWVAISFTNAWKWKVKVKLLSCVLLFATPWTAAH